MNALLWLVLGLAALLFLSLLELGRLKEIHHGYIGLALVGVSALFDQQFFLFLGLILLADDDVQHVWEAICKLLGRPIPGDFTPIHKLGSWLLGKIDAHAP